MHDAAFSKAALPATARVLGLELRPYSLGHELWLIRQDNPFSVSSAGPVSTAAAFEKLPEAVLICCHQFGEIASMNRDWLFQLKMKFWRRRIRKMNFVAELAAFFDYRNAGAEEFPDEPAERTGPSRRPGAPYLLRLNSFLIERLGLSELQAWDYPFGLAKMRHAAWLEAEGALNVKNEFDLAFDEQFEKWEREQPGNGLMKEDANA